MVNTGMRLADKVSQVTDLVQAHRGQKSHTPKRVSAKQMSMPDGGDLDLDPRPAAPVRKEPEWGLVIPKEKVHSFSIDNSVFNKIQKGVLKFLIMPRDPVLHIGDYLFLQEMDVFLGELTGNWVVRQITMLVENNPSIKENHVVLSLADADEAKLIGSLFSTERMLERGNRKLEWKISPGGPVPLPTGG